MYVFYHFLYAACVLHRLTKVPVCVHSDQDSGQIGLNYFRLLIRKCCFFVTLHFFINLVYMY